VHVIATAGHVDHGKSTLVEALTGINPDRLIEEQKREMTIDLGFAWLTLPDGQEIGIVDVPGHRDFIENMLAGVTGIDAVMLVIAANEGIMPQTREHLNIIDLLQINSGVIVLTKVDLVADPDWLEYLESEIKDSIKNTVLAEAPIARVSVKTGEGLENLKHVLVDVLKLVPEKKDYRKPRLPVDRVFSLAGFGTIVTGTLIGGSIKVGDSITIQPTNLSSRVRGLQTHKRKEVVAFPGSRTAINLSGVEVEKISRGDVITSPGQYLPTRRVDVHLTMLQDSKTFLKQNDSIKIYLGSAERVGRVRILGTDRLNPGESGWLQIETDKPFVADKEDHYILRRTSPAATLGGGTVLDAHPIGRYKLKDKRVLERLAIVTRGSPDDLILSVISTGSFLQVKEIIDRSPDIKEEGFPIIKRLILQKSIILIDGLVEDLNDKSLLCTFQTWEEFTRKTSKYLQDYHNKLPLRTGIPFEDLKTWFKLSDEYIKIILKAFENSGSVAVDQNRIRLSTHKIQYSVAQEQKKKTLWQKFSYDPFNPPSVEECKLLVGEELFLSLIETNELVQVSADVVFRANDYSEMLNYVMHTCKSDTMVTVGNFRDQFKTSRKYTLAFLEFLDRQAITRREGEGRVLT
jgi:selenocysteine-specific elongation factor